MWVSQKVNNCYFDHLNAYKILNIYKPNLATHALITAHKFPDIDNMTNTYHEKVPLWT